MHVHIGAYRTFYDQQMKRREEKRGENTKQKAAENIESLVTQS